MAPSAPSTVAAEVETVLLSDVSKPFRESFWQWRPTSLVQAERAEREMLAALDVPFVKSTVDVDGVPINTLTAGSGPPLVLLHGMAAATGFWVGNLSAWARHFTVHAIDLPGFGLSGRPPFTGTTVEEAEDYFLRRVEGWRAAVGIDRMALLGHSMGGYLSAVYTLRHPDRVAHLILADPWGIAPRDDARRRKAYPLAARLLFQVVTQFNPLSTIRVMGPWGPDLITRFRQDLARKFDGIYSNPRLVLDYVYHMNAQDPTGESAFSAMSDNLVWAKKPLIDRLPALDPAIFVSFIFGSKTWMDASAGMALAKLLGDRATFRLIEGAGHHVYIDNVADFNAAVLEEAALAQGFLRPSEALTGVWP